MRTLTKNDSDYESYADDLKPYVGDYAARNIPYWVLIENSHIVGIVAVGEEPLRLIEPLGTTVSLVHFVDYDQPPNVLDTFVKEAVRIAKEQNAAYSFVDFSDTYNDLVSIFTKNGYSEIGCSLLMTCELSEDYDHEYTLEFERVERPEVQNFLNNLKEFMKGSPDVVLEAILKNLGEFPEQFLDMWFQSEQLYYAHLNDELVGVLDLSPKSRLSISNIGISPNHRGKGYGYQLMLFGLKTLKDMGKDTAGLRVHFDNKVAKKLYESLGFQTVESRNALIWRK
jgi:ribosomal protein S18 acetylase RimI-like enzyme